MNLNGLAITPVVASSAASTALVNVHSVPVVNDQSSLDNNNNTPDHTIVDHVVVPEASAASATSAASAVGTDTASTSTNTVDTKTAETTAAEGPVTASNSNTAETNTNRAPPDHMTDIGSTFGSSQNTATRSSIYDRYSADNNLVDSSEDTSGTKDNKQDDDVRPLNHSSSPNPSLGGAIGSLGELRIKMLALVACIIGIAVSPMVLSTFFSSPKNVSSEGFSNFQSFSNFQNFSSYSDVESLRTSLQNMTDEEIEAIALKIFPNNDGVLSHGVLAPLRTSVITSFATAIIVTSSSWIVYKYAHGWFRDDDLKSNRRAWWLSGENALGVLMLLYVSTFEMHAWWRSLMKQSMDDDLIDSLMWPNTV